MFTHLSTILIHLRGTNEVGKLLANFKTLLQFALIKTMAQELMTYLELDTLLHQLTQYDPNTPKIPENHIRFICNTAKHIFLSQPMLLELRAPINVVGDIHGQFTDLLRIFKSCGYPPSTNYLFLGDYVDRGKQSVQTMVLLLCYKIKYSQNFFLLRGNHESAQINIHYGFYDECKRKYSTKVWNFFIDCFNAMPVAAVIEERILCMHGGISKQLKDFRTINTIQRPTEVPTKGILCDLLWSDPDEEQNGWQINNQRGVGWLFGASVLGQFLKENDLQLICRSHQVMEDGYQFFAKKQLVTIFSAPNYCGQLNNSGAVLSVGEELMCSCRRGTNVFVGDHKARSVRVEKEEQQKKQMVYLK